MRVVTPARQEGKTAALKALERALERALDAGYVPMLVVGKPAPRRQAITMSAVELKPMDGSDLSVCSCCANAFEQAFKSRLLANYLPLNWCPACRELLREGLPRQAVVERRGAAVARNGTRRRMVESEARLLEFLRKSVPAWQLKEAGIK